MSAIHDLISQVTDPRLRDRLAAEWAKASKDKKFGLVFEDHLPELLPLYKAKPRRGDLVCRRDGSIKDVWQVQKIKDGVALCIKPGNEADEVPDRAISPDAAAAQWPIEELLVVRQFGEPIFPSLVPVDAVANGPADAPWHTLIEADNYHALQLLEYLYAGQVDCIYIDPPYNTGARDWKYNNDYVDGNDGWRHSKWLSMMQRRLQIARRLLNPRCSVLIVTIDEKEYLRLGLLLEQTFPDARVQMVSITISPRSTSRANEFSRVDEFAFFVFIGDVELGSGERSGEDAEVRWLYLRRTQRTLVRGSRPRQFYPVYVDDSTHKIVKIGAPLAMEDKIEDVPTVKGATPVFPIAPDGTALIWGLTGPSLQQALEGGYVRVSEGNQYQPYTIAYLSTEDIKRVERGEYRVTGVRPDGSKIVVIPGGKASRPSTVWRESRHDAGAYQPLTNRGDGRQHLIWETLTNTARAIPDRFYVVIDEAHRGMTSGRGAQAARTLMQRFLLGHAETGLVKMPLVIGVSATPKRFMDLLEHAPHTVHKVAIPAEEVRKSGLLKDRILIHHPESATTAEMGLLEEAARRWNQMTMAWGAYCKDEQEATVWPVLVVQVENGSDRQLTKTDLADALTVIESAIGRRLNEGEVAHALHDTGDLDVGGRRVRKVEASRIDADKNIGVVFFKTSLSTGWDCPRAEVMMSFRRAEDHTYIAQLLGRMVRTPLARRIEKDAALNDVHLFLPYFDTQAVQGVVAALHNQEEVPPAETGSGRDLVVLQRRDGTDALFAALDELVTYRVNAARAQSPLRRFMAMSRSLTVDEIDEDAWARAMAQIVSWMGERVAALKAEGAFEAAAKAITHVGLRTLAVQNGTTVAEPGAEYQIGASSVDIDRLFEEAGRAFSHGLQMEYWRAHAERDAIDVKVEAIVLARDAAQMSELEKLAVAAFDLLYDRHKKSIHKLKEHRRASYEKLRLATATPNEVPWHLPDSIDFRRKPADPIWDRHLFVEGNGQFRAELGTWEAGVLKEELANENVVGWLRNVDRKPWSLEIPYETGGDVRLMFPDLVVVRQKGPSFEVDILEPHDPSLSDNFEKAVGLARFAQKHGALFGRIQLIRKHSNAGGEHYARLEINQASTIKRLLPMTSNPQLDDLFAELAT